MVTIAKVQKVSKFLETGVVFSLDVEGQPSQFSLLWGKNPERDKVAKTIIRALIDGFNVSENDSQIAITLTIDAIELQKNRIKSK